MGIGNREREAGELGCFDRMKDGRSEDGWEQRNNPPEQRPLACGKERKVSPYSNSLFTHGRAYPTE